MRRFLPLLLLFTTLSAGTVNLALSANVSYAAADLVAAFGKHHPGTKVRVTLGSSGKLTAQILHGAPYTLFLSADMKYPEALYEKGLAVTKPVVYAEGTLALFSKKPRDFSKGLALLADASVRRIAIANPRSAPYGKAALQAIRSAELPAEVEKKFIYGESVSQTTAYAMTAADVGLIAASSLHSPKMARFEKRRHWITVDPKLYTPIAQGIVILKKGAHDPETKAFYDFMLGRESRAILARYGYRLP